MKHLFTLFLITSICFSQKNKSIDGHYLALNNSTVYGLKINLKSNEISFFYHKKDTDTLQNWKKFVVKNIASSKDQSKFYITDKLSRNTSIKNRNSNPNMQSIESSNESNAILGTFDRQDLIEIPCNQLMKDFRNKYICTSNVIIFKRIN